MMSPNNEYLYAKGVRTGGLVTAGVLVLTAGLAYQDTKYYLLMALTEMVMSIWSQGTETK